MGVIIWESDSLISKTVGISTIFGRLVNIKLIQDVVAGFLKYASLFFNLVEPMVEPYTLQRSLNASLSILYSLTIWRMQIHIVIS